MFVVCSNRGQISKKLCLNQSCGRLPFILRELLSVWYQPLLLYGIHNGRKGNELVWYLLAMFVVCSLRDQIGKNCAN